VREYTNDEFHSLLARHFTHVELHGQVPAPSFGVCPYWQLAEDTGHDPRTRLLATLWKVGIRLPGPVRDRVFRTVTGHGPYPNEHEFVFEPNAVLRGHVQLAICRP
jgi:hypothetical protein